MHKHVGTDGNLNTGHQARVSPPLQFSPQSTTSSSISVPLLGVPSRFNSVADSPAFPFAALPTDVLLHMTGFLDAIHLVWLGRASTSLYRITGEIQRNMPGDHWRGGLDGRAVEQRHLTHKMLSWRQDSLNRQRSKMAHAMAPSAAQILEKLWAVELQGSTDIKAQASSIGSRFRHVRLQLNSSLSPEIREALADADGWHHLELVVSDIRLLAPFLLQLARCQLSKRAASLAHGVQPDRELSIHLRQIPLMSVMDIPHAVLVLKAVQAAACGLRVVSLQLPQELLPHFVEFVERSSHIEQFVGRFDWDAGPMLDALRTSRSALRSLKLNFSQAKSMQPGFGSFFNAPLEWRLDRLAIHACRLAAECIPLAFLASCRIREIQLHGLEFDGKPDAPSAFGEALAKNAVIECLEFEYCKFSIDGDVMHLLNQLGASVSLKCLKLQFNLLSGDRLLLPEVVSRVQEMTSLAEVHFDTRFHGANSQAIDQLGLARPLLRIIVGDELIARSPALIDGGSASGNRPSPSKALPSDGSGADQ